MLVLGIETSCDDTGLALVDENGLVASVMASQVPIHALLAVLFLNLLQENMRGLSVRFLTDFCRKVEKACSISTGLP